MVKIKICGITNLEDALKIYKLKPDALGFVFYPKSPRYISPKEAREIIAQFPKPFKKIGVFINEREQRIKEIAKKIGLNILQFHGNETPGFCKKFKRYKIIKAIRIKNKNSLKNLKKYSVWALLFDAYQENIYGGTGKKFNWEIIKDIKPYPKNIFLSGGLDAQNVRGAIKLIKPTWVDVSSSVEIRPGEKDIRKVKEFIQAVRKGR